MSLKQMLLLCATLCFYLATIAAQVGAGVKISSTRFTCQGRAAGYYADLETGCQVYHMCDGLGRQFSYSCPNTTLFQQRMLICDHWYMVNCSMSERDYKANLLIGQRDKPFVSDEEMGQRTPRPDILSVPPNRNYYDGLREAESKFPIHPGNSIVGVADSISSDDDNDLYSSKQNYRPPTSWSTGTGKKHSDSKPSFNTDFGASQLPGPTFKPTQENVRPTENTNFNKITGVKLTPPSQVLSLPLPPPTTEASSEEFQIDARLKKVSEGPVFQFIKRFDPNSPDSHKTAMSKSEIINLNQHLPAGQVSAEDERTPRKNKEFGNKFNKVETDNDKGFVEGSRFNTVNIKSGASANPAVPVPDRELLPPKTNYTQLVTTTMGPPIYYEWKWAVPAFGLEPPKESNITESNNHQTRSVTGRSPFRDVTRPTPVEISPTPDPKNTEYDINSYFVPDYVFPLDKPHPGYDNDNAQTSFQVGVAKPGKDSYGENPACPQCHPAYLKPGTCEPCIVKR